MLRRRGRWPYRRFAPQRASGDVGPPLSPDFWFLADAEYIQYQPEGGLQARQWFDGVDPASPARAALQTSLAAQLVHDLSTYARPALVGTSGATHMTFTPPYISSGAWSWYLGSFDRPDGIPVSWSDPASGTEYFAGDWRPATSTAVISDAGGITSAVPGVFPPAVGALRQTIIHQVGVGLDYSDDAGSTASAGPDRSPVGMTTATIGAIQLAGSTLLQTGGALRCWVGYNAEHTPAEQAIVNAWVEGQLV